MDLQNLFHPVVMAEAAPAADDAKTDSGTLLWEKWIMPWLWKTCSLLTANEPGEMLKNFLKYLLIFLTAHKF